MAGNPVTMEVHPKVDSINERSLHFRSEGFIEISHDRICKCPPTHINCMTAKEWIKNQLGVWEFYYEGRDIRDKALHPATFPIALARRVIDLFSHEGELVMDPFIGSGTTLLAAQDANRNAIGFDINEKYIALCNQRLKQARLDQIATGTKQIPVLADARCIDKYVRPGTVSLSLTSPPYANLLNRKRLNKSRRDRHNEQFLKVEQYSQRPEDLGTLSIADYEIAMTEIYSKLLPLHKEKAHCVINVADMWWENTRVPIHIYIISALEKAGFKLRNTIIWDRTNIVNNIGIFGWPSNYITMGTTFEYILDFWRPPSEKDETVKNVDENAGSNVL
jgi:DNA modification methylase